MVLKKTSWLATIFPMRIGAMIGSRGAADLTPFLRFGFFLGAAFQIQDDLLNLIADERYGKERDGDIWEGKRPLMLLHLYRCVSSCEKKRILEMLDTPRSNRSATEVQWVRQSMDAHDSIAYAQGIAHGIAGAAKTEFSHIFKGVPASRDKRFLEGMITWVFERN